VLVRGVRTPAGIATPFPPTAIPAADAYLAHTWLRSWRTLYRVVQALRRSGGLHTANREFAVRRIWEVLNTSWAGAVSFAAPVPPATLGSLFTSQSAVVALMRWHINLPGRLFGSGPGFAVQPLLNNAVTAADAAYRAAQPIGAAVINTATLAVPASPGAVAFQAALIAALTAAGADQRTVRAPEAVAARLPDGTQPSALPGSYAGPAAPGTYP
jgi:hypothetical protein